MRTHSDIISDAGGPAKFARAVGVDVENAKSWKRLNSIPQGHWTAIDAAGIATLIELSNAVAKPRNDGRLVLLDQEPAPAETRPIVSHDLDAAETTDNPTAQPVEKFPVQGEPNTALETAGAA